MRIPQEDSEPPIEVKIVPLIDVIFAILTFFIMSTLFLTRNEGLSVSLPKATTAKTQQQVRIAITLQPNRQLALNRQPIQLEQIETGVRALMPANQMAIVVIQADENVKHGQVVTVMDRLKRIEGVKLAIATKHP